MVGEGFGRRRRKEEGKGVLGGGCCPDNRQRRNDCGQKSVLERRTELLRFMATSLLHRENVIRQWHMRLERSWQKNCGAVSIRY